jgi:hypothetical protein
VASRVLEKRSQGCPVLGLAIQALQRRRHSGSRGVRFERAPIGAAGGIDIVETPLPDSAQLREHCRARRFVHVRRLCSLLENFHEFFVSAEPGEDFAERLPDEIVVGIEFERECEFLIGTVRFAPVRVERREFE